MVNEREWAKGRRPVSDVAVEGLLAGFLAGGVMALVLLAAILGLFGNGLFSETTASVSNGDTEVSLSYPRWDRMSHPIRIELEIESASLTEETLQVTLSNDLTKKMQIENVLPEPDSSSIGPEGAVYEWQVQDWAGKLLIKFEYRGTEWRTVRGDVKVSAGQRELGSLELSQFLFP